MSDDKTGEKEPAHLLLTELPKHSVRVHSATRLVRIDDNPDEVEQTYLMIEGTPDGYRWLANHFARMAKSADESTSGCSNILAPWDFQNEPVKLEIADSIEFTCRKS